MCERRGPKFERGVPEGVRGVAEKSAHVRTSTGAGKGQLGWRSAWIGRIRRWRCYWFRVPLAPKKLFKRKLRCLYINFAG